MELLTCMSDRDAWVPFPGVLQGLRLSRASSSELLLYTEDPVADLGEMAAFVSLFKVCGGAIDRLRVASPYPSPVWIGGLRADGVRRVFFAPGFHGAPASSISRAVLVEAPRDLCPALHVRGFDGRAASVCGCRFDLLLLGRKQFTEQCFARWSACRWMSQAGEGVAAAREESPCTSLS